MKKTIAVLGFSMCVFLIFLNFASAKGGGGGGTGSGFGGSTPAPDPKPETAQEEPVQETQTEEVAQEPAEQPATSTPDPTPTTATPSCSQDEFSCTEYGKCELDGRQRRSCSTSFDCPGVQTQSPDEEQICEGLKCGHLDSLKERVECRIKLHRESRSAFTQEQKILYAPEYCRLKVGADQEECLNTYWLLEPCWEMKDNHERHECLDRVTGMDQFETKKEECLSQSEQTECKAELKAIGKWCLIANLYDISQRAEDLYEVDRATLSDVLELDIFIEEQKAKLDRDERVRAWRTVLEDVKNFWTEFKQSKVN